VNLNSVLHWRKLLVGSGAAIFDGDAGLIKSFTVRYVFRGGTHTMSYIKFDSSKLDKFVHANELEQMQPLVTAADKELREGTGAGKDFRGFLDLPVNYDKDEFARIKAAAKKIQGNSQVFVAIGIGGSFLRRRRTDGS